MNTIKKVLFLILISFLVLLTIGYIIGEKEGKNIKGGAETDANIIYSSKFFAGLCSNERGDNVACYTEYYLYKNGQAMKKIGWMNTEERKDNIPEEKILSSEEVAMFETQIDSYGISPVTCPEEEIFDASWDYVISTNNKNMTLHNPPKNCRDDLDKIDKLLGSLIKEK